MLHWPVVAVAEVIWGRSANSDYFVLLLDFILRSVAFGGGELRLLVSFPRVHYFNP